MRQIQVFDARNVAMRSPERSRAIGSIVDRVAVAYVRPVLTEELVMALNAGYVCPPDAGPAWRQAVAEGVDMSLVERTLARSPWDRLEGHDEALCFAQMLQRATHE